MTRGASIFNEQVNLLEGDLSSNLSLILLLIVIVV